MPALGAYRKIAPEVEVDITLTDRNVDLVEEGFDVAFRIGSMRDSSMIARRLAPYRMAVCAAPDYLTRAGTPAHPRELEQHETIAFSPSARAPWRFVRQGEEVDVTPIRMITVNSGQAVRTAAQAGLGVIMQPEILVRRDIENGALIRLFPDWPLRERPMWLLYYRDRKMTPRLRSFITFATSAFAAPESLS
nr:LysR substrate-binding domain-containing protein [Martelella alba]